MPSLAALLVSVITGALSTFLSKLLTSLGLAIFTYNAVAFSVTRLLDLVQPYIDGLPTDIISLLSLAGVGQALTIVFSAVVARASMTAAKTFIGVDNS